MAGATRVWFPVYNLGSPVMFNLQENRFLMCCFREVWVPCVCAELGSGTGRDFGLGLLQIWIVGFTNCLYIQFCNCSTVQLQENHFPCDCVPLMLCSSITPLTSASESSVRGYAVLSRHFFLSLCKMGVGV